MAQISAGSTGILGQRSIFLAKPRTSEQTPKPIDHRIVTLAQAAMAAAGAGMLVGNPLLQRGEPDHFHGCGLGPDFEEICVVLANAAGAVGEFPKWKFSMPLTE
jgi:hypothetical protein